MPARSRFFTGAAACVAGLGLVRHGSAAAQFDWKLASSDPVDLATSVRMIQMSDAVTAETRGRLTIKAFPSGVLGSQTALVSQLRLGSIQLMHSGHSTYTSVVPVVQISASGFVFANDRQALAAMDGSLGAYIRSQFATRGLYCFEKSMLTGLRHVTSSKKPIRNVDDLAGFKVRVQPSPINVDLFKALGASPVPIDINELYTAMQTHLVDGEENTLPSIEGFRFFEVQQYLSMTGHQWGGEWLVGNADAIDSLPPDLQAVLKRNAEKYLLLEQGDINRTTGAVLDKLKRQGMATNAADTTGMKAQLGAYYAHWKTEFGPTVWALLEGNVGRLG